MPAAAPLARRTKTHGTTKPAAPLAKRTAAKRGIAKAPRRRG
jgi:hypothetical protein